MKPVFLTLTLAALLAAGVSTGCGKDDENSTSGSKGCWTCTITIVNRSAYFPETNSTSRSDQTVCSKTEAEIRDGEKEGTYTTSSGSGSFAVSTAVTTTCKRQ